ncbi:MAG: hypothetical protein HC896_04025 [Bacteroidales bacterium]|nr:hypothetical protein [Bacteroidales bacterium]
MAILLLVVTYILLNKAKAKEFAISFFVVYFQYTFFELAEVLRMVKQEKN